MPQELTFAQALTEAKQIIVQQALRIKSDAEKIKIQHETNQVQTATITEQETRISQQVDELRRMSGEMEVLNQKFSEALIAKDQADAVINRQGEKITTLQSTVTELERKVAEQSERIHILERDYEVVSERLPTQEDTDALAAMSALLAKKSSGSGQSHSMSIPQMSQMPPMRLAEAA